MTTPYLVDTKSILVLFVIFHLRGNHKMMTQERY